MAITWTGSAVTGQVQGDNQDYMALCALVNDRFSNRKVTIRRCLSQLDQTSLVLGSTTLLTPVYTYRGSGTPTLGNYICTADKCPFDTNNSSSSKIQLYYPATGGGINNSVLAGTPTGGIAWRQWLTKLRTGAEQFLSYDNNQLPALLEKTANEWVLYPGQYLFVRADAIVVGDVNPGSGFFVEMVWQEEDIPTHAISGTVTLSAVGVVGAEVVVLVADDTALTNAVLWGVYTTTAGGAWTTANDIPDGKIAYAYCSDYATSTYYTATGAPFVS